MVVRIAGPRLPAGASAATSTTTTRSPRCATIPGVVIACPARPDERAGDAARPALAAAEGGRHGQRVPRAPSRCITRRDLHEAGDDGWLAPYDPPPTWPARHVPIGRARPARRRHRPDDRGRSANGVRMSLRAAWPGSPARPASAAGFSRPALACPRCRSRTSCARASVNRPGGWWPTRPGAPAGCPRGVDQRAWPTAGFTGRMAPRGQARTASSRSGDAANRRGTAAGGGPSSPLPGDVMR